jgi:phage terminase large subunit
MSIRGKMPAGYFNQTVASFNPWNEQHFIVKELTSKLTPNEQTLIEKGKQELIVEDEQEFEYQGKMVKEKVSQLLMITNYKINEFLDIKDYARYEKKKKEDYEDYKTSGLGMPGVSKGLIFRNWHIEDTEKYKNTFELIRRGLDFGYSSDPSAFLQFNVDLKAKRIVVFDEFGATELTNEMLANELKRRIEPYALIKADAAEPKSIAELNNLGINAIPVQKGPDSILHGIKWLKGFEIIVDPKCKGLINELGLYKWKTDKQDNPLNIPEDKNNHYIDALRYGSDDLYLRN